jgi:predicted MPP superfamily phosphohydrolase
MHRRCAMNWWLLLKLLAGIAVYSAGIEPRFIDRNDEQAVVPNLTPSWDGERIAVFSDVHVGMLWANTDAVRRAVRQVVSIHPAAVLIAGDFIWEPDRKVDDDMRKVVDLLRPILDDSIPIYAVLGNHDYSLMNEHSEQENYVASRVRLGLRDAGVHMVDNAVEPLALRRVDGLGWDTLYIAGIGEKWAKNDHAAETVARVPAGKPRVVFMHDPDSFAKIPAGEAPFAVAGHTHGMQVGVPWVSDYLWRHYFSDAGSGVEGWQDGFGEPGNHLYITRGIGFAIVPARLHAVPELTVFTLKAR